MGAAAETFRCIYSNQPEHARLDRARLAEDLCDALIHLVGPSIDVPHTLLVITTRTGIMHCSGYTPRGLAGHTA